MTIGEMLRPFENVDADSFIIFIRVKPENLPVVINGQLIDEEGFITSEGFLGNDSNNREYIEEYSKVLIKKTVELQLRNV